MTKRVWVGLVSVAAAIAIVVACSSQGPTGPVEPQRDVANVSTPNPVAGVVPVPGGAVPGALVPVGVGVNIDEGRVTIYTASKPLDYKVCVYKLEAAYPGPQVLTFESDRQTASVGTSVFTVPVPVSCQYQVDVIDWRMCPTAGNPPTFGGGLMAGFLSDGAPCPKPSPAPTPSPSPSPSPSPTPSPSPSPTPSPSPSPTPSPSPSPTPSPSPSPSPTPSPTPTPPPCVVEWVEQAPVYGVWGECKVQAHDVSRSCTSACHQYRTVTISEKEICTGAVRVMRTYQESRDCVCPVPVGICHVSNKGNPDGNNNLQVSWKLEGVGHEKHVCPEFNPPDFASTEAECKVENVRFCQ